MKKFLFLIGALILSGINITNAEIINDTTETIVPVQNHQIDINNIKLKTNSAETGIRILKDHKEVYIIDVVKESPAEKSGILAGTRLYKINNINIENFSPIEIVNLLYGQENSKITLQIKAYNKKGKITLERQVLNKAKTEAEEYMQYWSQIAPPYFCDKKYLINNEEYPRNIKRYVFANNYWVDRRTNFESSYKSCNQSANKIKCITQLVQREKEIKNNPKGREWFMRMADQLYLFEMKTQ